MEDKTVKIIVSGLVQGVAYRYHTLLKAKSLGLVGQVQNLITGQVEIIAQGENEKIEKLITWSKEGPPAARVNNIVSKPINKIKSNIFIIKR